MNNSMSVDEMIGRLMHRKAMPVDPRGWERMCLTEEEARDIINCSDMSLLRELRWAMEDIVSGRVAMNANMLVMAARLRDIRVENEKRAKQS